MALHPFDHDQAPGRSRLQGATSLAKRTGKPALYHLTTWFKLCLGTDSSRVWSYVQPDGKRVFTEERKTR